MSPSHYVVFVEDQTIDNIEKVKAPNIQLDGVLIDFEPIPMIDKATHWDASLQDEEHEDVHEPSTVVDRIGTNHANISTK